MEYTLEEKVKELESKIENPNKCSVYGCTKSKRVVSQAEKDCTGSDLTLSWRSMCDYHSKQAAGWDI